MIETVSEGLAAAIELYRNISSGIGNTSDSRLSLKQSTTFSSDLVYEEEQVLSEAQHSNLSESKVPLESKIEYKEESTLGKSTSTADKRDKTIAGEGGIKVGTSNLWAIAVIDANGKISLSKTDGTTRTWTDDNKNVNSVTKSHSCKVEVSPGHCGTLIGKRILTVRKSSTEILIEGGVSFLTCTVPIGEILTKVLSVESVNNESKVSRIFTGKPVGKGFLVQNDTIYKRDYIEFIYNEVPLVVGKQQLQTEISVLKQQNEDQKKIIKEFEKSSSSNSAQKSSTLIA